MQDRQRFRLSHCRNMFEDITNEVAANILSLLVSQTYIYFPWDEL